MKSISRVIWVLCAFVTLAALDTRPDPPAVKPAGSASRLLAPHIQPTLPAVQRCIFAVVSDPSFSNGIAADISEQSYPVDSMFAAIGQAADSSPPTPFLPA